MFLIIFLFGLQACVRKNRRSREFYGQLPTCEVERHSNIGLPKVKGSRVLEADFGEGETLLHNEYCDYEDGPESEEEDLNIPGRVSTVRT